MKNIGIVIWHASFVVNVPQFADNNYKMLIATRFFLPPWDAIAITIIVIGQCVIIKYI